jgi:hypothetical protein
MTSTFVWNTMRLAMVRTVIWAWVFSNAGAASSRGVASPTRRAWIATVGYNYTSRCAGAAGVNGKVLQYRNTSSTESSLRSAVDRGSSHATAIYQAEADGASRAR